MCYSICGMVHIKSERLVQVAPAGFLSHYLSGPLPPYNRKYYERVVK